MRRARQAPHPGKGAELVDFDRAILEGCADDERRDLETEADLLTTAFSASPRSLDEIAWTITRTAPPRGLGGLRARRLAAILRLRARRDGG
jgi:hypothetical protein